MKVATAVLLASILLTTFAFSNVFGAEWVTVKSWTGSGIMTTEKFWINTSSWKVIWKVSNLSPYGGSLLQVWVYDKNNEFIDLLANSAQSGESFMHHGKGNYYFQISSANLDWEILVQEPREVKSTTQITEKVSLSNLQLVDQLGSRISSVSVGQQMILQSSVKNNVGIDQKFAYIMQIKDSDGITMMIAWINGELPVGKTFDIGLSWIPEAAGKYAVDVFVWQNVANPLPLSSKTITTTITVT